MADLNTDVRYIKGIGEQRAKALAKVGIHTLRDLIAYLPRAYEDRREKRTVAALRDGENACVEAMVAAPPQLSRIRKGLEVVKVRAVDATGVLFLTFFNQPYRRDSLKTGETYLFFGRAEGMGSRRQMVNPLVERPGQEVLTGRIVPIYPLTAGVTQSLLLKSMEQGLAVCRDLLEDPIPPELRRLHRLCSVSFAYEQIHFPAGEDSLAQARRRLAFEELFLLTLALGRLRGRRAGEQALPCPRRDLTPFLSALPFSLTGAQARAVEEVTADLGKSRPMNRLVQGDVGSGKTMVAAAALYLAAENGLQAALMAPTSLLARQHYETLAPLLEGLGISCALLTGAAGARERRQVLAELADGTVQVLIGTHALISADVTYHRLGLVITDEQHRFGVNQRSALSAKGQEEGFHPHLLVMSATPIPRTLALIIYGDLDVSVIDQLPPGRQRVDTFAVSGGYRQRIYAFLDKELSQGRQAYVICPMVEQADTIGDERKAATEYAALLRRQLPSRWTVGLVHGRMKPREKEAVMAAFSTGEIHVLVSTTVVEVGVDVPNATVMVVENADRFGLSQLHQLRGRVGRGVHKSYCILISDSQNPDTRERLKVMTRSSDGFAIAEEDLRLRGPGDFFGSRQHGLPAMKAADLSLDMGLLAAARDSAQEVLAEDPLLEQPRHAAARRRLRTLLDTASGALN